MKGSFSNTRVNGGDPLSDNFIFRGNTNCNECTDAY